MITPLFLFSLPRSGSTLAQRMLATHPAVATATEPWILLPFLYARKEEGVYAEYRHDHLRPAIIDFIEALPHGAADYDDALRTFALDLYRRAAGSEPTYFLDKTPRYHLILPELMALFPEAKAVFLWRHPLAVLASIIETWGEGRWNAYLFKVDLFKGVENLVAGYRQHEGRALGLRYEDLVRDPEAAWQTLSTYLDLPADQAAPEAFADVDLGGRMGDKTGAARYQQVSTDSLERWKATLASPLRKAWARRYLHWIGADRLAVMGYDLEELLAALDSVPARWSGTAKDALHMGRGLLHPWVEPVQLRAKWKARGARHRIVAHG